MRPVNLLPERHRPAAPSGGRSGVAYLVLGGLGALLVAAVVYGFTAHQVASRDAEAGRLAAEAAEAESAAAELAPFGDFRSVMQTRVASVSTLAQARIDWERLTRELSELLPRSVRLTKMEGATTPESSEDSTSEDSTSTSTTNAPAGPTVVLEGCSKSQPAVARTLVRMRRMHGAEDVTLQDSDLETQGGEEDAGSGECGLGYAFTATVHLAPVSPDAQGLPTSENVPVSLGGGP